MREIHRDIVAAVLLDRHQQILFVKKNPALGGVYPDCWQIPGGGIEPGETREDALTREVREEVGLDLQRAVVEPLDDTDGSSAPKRLSSGEEVLCHMKFFVYRAALPFEAGELAVSLGGELSHFRWVSPVEVRELKLVPAGVRLFERRWKEIFR